MKDLIKQIVKTMVDSPEEVEVSAIEGDRITVLELRVSKADIGKVIGKKGRNVRAIRTILSAASAKEKKHTVLEILE